MNEITNLFNTFLFPTALCILFIYFFVKLVRPEIKATLERVTKTNESLSKTNEILAEKLERKVEDIGSDLKEVNKKIDKLF